MTYCVTPVRLVAPVVAPPFALDDRMTLNFSSLAQLAKLTDTAPVCEPPGLMSPKLTGRLVVAVG